MKRRVKTLRGREVWYCFSEEGLGAKLRPKYKRDVKVSY